MKNPLNYQTTEYDCGPTTMTNAIRFLFERDEIPPDIIKNIVLYSLDGYNKKGEFGKSGTSGFAMSFLSNWMNHFGKVKKFPVQCEFVTGSDVYIGQNSKIVCCLQQGGAVVLRLMYGCWHYVLLTGADDKYIYMFDPYFRKKEFHIDGIELITNAPAKMNRKVYYEIFNDEKKGVYALGPKDIREAVIMFNTETRKALTEATEYFI